jgi:uncharacterized membrane protein (DUF373 family)
MRRNCCIAKCWQSVVLAPSPSGGRTIPSPADVLGAEVRRPTFWRLTAVVGLVIIAALFELCLRVVLLLLNGLIDPADQEVFQALFGMILTVLIALEFNHSIMEVLERENSIVQVRTVVLIALLALVRKFIVLDTTKTDPLTIIGLAAAVLALGSAHWMVRDRERKDTQEKTTPRTL